MIKENKHTLGYILIGKEQNQMAENLLSWMSTSHTNITDENGEERRVLD